ncbi:hypothetical protein [Halosimplex sp. J119]
MRLPNPAKIWRLWREDLQADEALSEPFPYRAWKWLWQRLPARNRRPDLFDRLDEIEWDVVVLLDACRYDVLDDVASNAVIGRTTSPASATPEFLKRARERGVFDGTVYVSGNPQSDANLPGDVEHVPAFEDSWDDGLATVPPEPLYEAARERLGDGDGVVVHTLQPHYPHLCNIGGRTRPIPGGLHPRYFDEELHDEKLQALLTNGYLDLDTARRSYERSVRFAWERASEFAATAADEGYRVVISADHGEVFGERGFVEHPMGVSIPGLKAVPWVVFEPSSDADGADDVTDRLAALGYVEN